MTAEVPWKTLSERRADFPRADITYILILKLPFLTQPPRRAGQILSRAPNIRSPLSLSSGGKIEFPGQKEKLEPDCCWESGRAAVPVQLPKAGGPNASICHCPGHCHLPGHHQPVWAALQPSLPLWTAACSACAWSAGKIPRYVEKPVSPGIRIQKLSVTVCWDRIARPCLSLPTFFYFFSLSISLMCIFWFCNNWLEKLKVPNFSSFTHMCCAPQARQHILVARLRRTFTTLPLKNSLYFSCWAGSHPMWHSSMSHAVTATASMETHRSMRPAVG